LLRPSAETPEFVVVRVRNGEVVGDENWVYTWTEADGWVVYVGATALDPATRVWLHLNDPDPDVGRMAARFDRLVASQLEVLAMRVPDEISRADVRDVLGARLADEGLLAEDAITDHLQLVLDPPPEALELADRYVARLRSYLEQRDPARL
jgi:hypothetical protein